MAYRKSKIEILDKIITKQEIKDGLEYDCWCDDDLIYHDSYCECYFCMPIDYSYEYLPDEFQPKSVIIGKIGIRIIEYKYSPGKLIDMSSIYSKEVLRQKRINHILGIELIENSRPTLADILNIKK